MPVEQSGGTDIAQLLEHMSPQLKSGEFVFLSFAGAEYGAHRDLDPIGSFIEEEGLTLVVPRELADDSQHAYTGIFKCITLQVHSSLEAVGLTAAFAAQLASVNISANVIAGHYHDHIFIAAQDAASAMAALTELSKSS